MASQKTMLLLATKLGIADDEKVLSKAAEFERLLQSKSLAGSNITDTAKVVICLDLASAFCGADLDVKAAIKYSGLKTPSYTASRKTIENLLELNTERLTVNSLCLTLQCTTAQSMAEKILNEYRMTSKAVVDMNLPQYVCMAVYHACRLNKIKVTKSKLIEKSRLKPSQWTRLDEDWTKFVDQNFSAKVESKKGRPRKEKVEVPEEMQDDIIQPVEVEKKEPEIHTESYEDWKRRMLDSARQELKELQNKDGLKKQQKTMTPTKEKTELSEVKGSLDQSPRRSPRKTPHKFTPYTESPKKPQGVRLLFSL